jgi:hypothetical protein
VRVSFLAILVCVVCGIAFGQWEPDQRLTNDPANSFLANPNNHPLWLRGTLPLFPADVKALQDRVVGPVGRMLPPTDSLRLATREQMDGYRMVKPSLTEE